MAKELAGVQQFDKEELKAVLKKGSWQPIDVRTDEEYQAGHIPNVPLKPMQNIAQWASELDTRRPYVFICRSGSRSQQVAQYLRQNGFSQIANFAGGMLTWDGKIQTGQTAE